MRSLFLFPAVKSFILALDKFQYRFMPVAIYGLYTLVIQLLQRCYLHASPRSIEQSCLPSNVAFQFIHQKYEMHNARRWRRYSHNGPFNVHQTEYKEQKDIRAVEKKHKKKKNEADI